MNGRWRELGVYARGVFLLLTLVACGRTSGCSGCDQEGPPFPDKDRIQSAVQVRLSSEGIGFLEQNFEPILTAAVPDGLTFCIPGQSGSAIGVDYGFCDSDPCSDGSIGCEIAIAIGGVDLEPVPAPEVAPGVPDERRGTLRATVRFDALDARFQVYANPVVDCTVTLAAPGFPVSIDVDLDTPDPQRDLSFSLRNPAYRLADLDIRLRGNGGFLSPLCDVIDGVINFPIIGDFIFDVLQGFIDGFLVDLISGFVEDFTCRTCESEADCPLAGGTTCDGGRCMSGGQCIPAPLGLQGTLDVGSLLSGFSPGLQALLQYLANPGSYVQVEQEGLSLGVVAGATSQRNRCVPLRAPPQNVEPPRAESLRGNVAPDGTSFEVGLGVSDVLLDHAMWAAFNSGLLCVQVSGENIEQLSTRFLSLPLPSLRALARDVAPMAVTLSPQDPPTFVIGANTVVGPDEDGNYTLDDPLLTVTIPELWIDFHLWMEGRWTRAFSLRTDVILPVGIAFSADNGIIPILGDLTSAIHNLEAHNGEILLDDPNRLAALLPALIGPLLGGLTDGLLQPIALPDIMGYQLDLQHSQVTGIENNTFIGVFAGLERRDGVNEGEGAGYHVETKARRVALQVPPTGEFEEDGTGVWRKVGVTLDLAGEDGTRDAAEMEYSVKVDDHSWSLFSPAARRTVRSPAFALQGHHTILVRGRRVDDYRTLDPTPEVLDVIIDSMAPELAVEVLAEGLQVTASDWVSPREALNVEVRFDDGAWQAVADDRVALPEGALTAQLRATDEAGNVATAEVQVGEAALIGRLPPGEAGAGGGCGCSVDSSNKSSGWGALALLALVGFGRRRRRLQVAGAALMAASAGFMGGCDDTAPAGDPGEVEVDLGPGPDVDPCDACNANQVCRDDRCVVVTCTADPAVCAGVDCSGGREATCNPQGVCQCEDFCPEGCGEEQYCCQARNRCESVPQECGPMECEPGFEVAVTRDGVPNPETCMTENVECSCVEKAPLEVTKIGRFSEFAVQGNVLWISGYAEDFGDLVVGRYQDPGEVQWQFVDGVPEAAEVVRGPSGPRGGRVLPGQNVGTHTGIAVGNEGALHVVYRDETDKALKYALGTPAGAAHSWQIQVLDAEGDPGRWAVITVDARGVPGVAYQVLETTVDGVLHSQVRYLLAKNPSPAAAADWNAPLLVHSRPLPEGGAVTATYPEGTGLFLSVARDPSDAPVLAFYDRTAGALLSSRFTGAGFSEPEMLAGWGHPEREGDFGANVDLIVDADGNRHFCYQDGLTDSLRYLSPELGLDEWVDDGVRLGDGGRDYAVHVVGDDCNMRLDPAGNPVIIYQDATGHDLLLARGNRDGGGWVRLPLRGQEATYQGAFGFYARAHLVGGTLWMSHYVYAHEEMPARQYLEVLRRGL